MHFQAMKLRPEKNPIFSFYFLNVASSHAHSIFCLFTGQDHPKARIPSQNETK